MDILYIISQLITILMFIFLSISYYFPKVGGLGLQLYPSSKENTATPTAEKTFLRELKLNFLANNYIWSIFYEQPQIKYGEISGYILIGDYPHLSINYPDKSKYNSPCTRKYNFINKSGQVMLNEDAVAVSQFYTSGRALVLRGYGKKQSGTIIDKNFNVTAYFEGDIPPYDKEGLEYWSGMVYCSGGIYNAGPFIDLTDGKGYRPHDLVKHEVISRVVSKNLLYAEVGNGMSSIPTFITRIGCRVKFYIDKDEF